MTEEREELTHVEEAMSRRRLRKVLLLVGVPLVLVLVLIGWLKWKHPEDRPVRFDDPVEHFKYGSIGSDVENGLPLEIVRILPRMFPEYLPEGYTGAKDYRAFGFVYEDGHEMPIGFSTRRRRIDLVGLNCASCHTGQWRLDETSELIVIPGGTANTVNIEHFFRFLFDCALDTRFTADAIIEEIEKDRSLDLIEGLLVRLAVPQLRAGLLRQRVKLSYIYEDGYPGWGHGSVDTFNPYKLLQFASTYPNGIPPGEEVAMADYPAVWKQAAKKGMNLHWDGDNSDTRERNVSAAFGAGATPENLDREGMEHVAAWLDDLEPPPFPAKINDALLKRGAEVYRLVCFDCHAFEGLQVGQVIDIEKIGTDRARLDSFTEKFIEGQNEYLKDYPDLAFKNFRKTNGYTNMPLDGIWARAPYLHNGSVPTMWDLLTRDEDRPKRFYRGHGVYDTKKLGIRIDVEQIDGRRSWLHDTTRFSKGKQGHSGEKYGTELSDADKWALIEYLKTL